ncbi:MAG: GMC oxidoreductase [Thiohalocapsa sp.]
MSLAQVTATDHITHWIRGQPCNTTGDRVGEVFDPSLGAVSNCRLRVVGLHGPRVVDASIIPTITSCNTSSPTIMIAACGARMIQADRQPTDG